MDNSEDLDLYTEELNEESKYTQIAAQSFDIVKALKIPVNGYMGEAPSMPKDISSLTDAELGDNLNKQTQWAGYLSQKLSEFESYLTILENELEFTTASIHSGYLKNENISKTKITERKELIKTDKRYILLNKEKLKYEIICNIIKANLNAANNNWVNLSRQITLKGQDEQRQFRTNNALNFVSNDSKPRSNLPSAFRNATIGGGPTTNPAPKRATRK